MRGEGNLKPVATTSKDDSLARSSLTPHEGTRTQLPTNPNPSKAEGRTGPHSNGGPHPDSK